MFSRDFSSSCGVFCSLCLFSLWYKVNSAAFESDEKRSLLKTGQSVYVCLHFWFSTSWTLIHVLIIYYVDYCCMLANCFQKHIAFFQRAWKCNCSEHPAYLFIRWPPFLCFTSFLFCVLSSSYLVLLSSFSFSYLLLCCSYFFFTKSCIVFPTFSASWQ